MGFADPPGEALLGLGDGDDMNMILHQTKGPHVYALLFGMSFKQSEIEGLILV